MTPYEHALTVLVGERIAELIRFRTWYRRQALLRPYFIDMENADRNELKTLLRLRREARNIARAAQVEQDRAVDAWKDEWRAKPDLIVTETHDGIFVVPDLPRYQR